MHRTIAAMLACAALLAASIASPALGGPSLGSVTKTAKKALKIGKSAKRSASAAKRSASAANRAANSAKQTAGAAQSLASTANGKADQALAKPVITPNGLTPVVVSVDILPGDFETAAAVCPAGQRAISGGVTSITADGGIWANEGSSDRTAWIGGGEDLGSVGGTLTVTAYCAPAGGAVAATVRRAAVRRDMAALERKKQTKQ